MLHGLHNLAAVPDEKHGIQQIMRMQHHNSFSVPHTEQNQN